ncbi:MAG: 3-dehydroquinate synthase [Rhizobiales bacterium NRL2]|jgi:3-dehydroquinate synthase|nr:MAG: 3-dehydroquinate synthase [Rhizobiales bacterium NRL2]
MTRTVRVDLGARSYDIAIGAGLLAGAGDAMKAVLSRPRVVIVTDRNVADAHLGTVEASCVRSGIETAAIVLPPGEATKSFAELEHLCGALIDRRVGRDDMILALGGGVIGDLAGFAASILRRGVDFIQAPTTLLAQVDSSVGGKTAVNVPQGKNLIGAFHQPRLVLADVAALDTLPPREVLAGYAEVVKYGLLGDRDFFDWLEVNGPAIVDGDRAARIEAVARSCQAKARIVAADERESGERALLNLGHTFGHALEAEGGFDGTILHGEAVAIGMVQAFELSARLGFCHGQDVERVRRHFTAVGLPTRPADRGLDGAPAERLLHHMAQDKKVRDGRLTFVLVRGIGEAFVTRDVEAPAVSAYLSSEVA